MCWLLASFVSHSFVSFSIFFLSLSCPPGGTIGGGVLHMANYTAILPSSHSLSSSACVNFLCMTTCPYLRMIYLKRH